MIVNEHTFLASTKGSHPQRMTRNSEYGLGVGFSTDSSCASILSFDTASRDAQQRRRALEW